MSHSIRRRFTASLFGNIFRSGISFATGLLLARLMGPSDYGRMAFLLASFVALRQLLDMASSSAFFTFLSQRQRSRRFVAYFWRWVALQFGFSLFLIAFLLPGDWVAEIWKGEIRPLLLLAFAAAFMQGTVWQIAAQMAEAQRETIRLQRLSVLVAVTHLAVVLILWWVGQLAIPLLFAALALEWGGAGWIAAKMYRAMEPENPADSVDTPASVVLEYWRFCWPYLPYTVLGFAHDFADRWMLQRWGGSSEQAYYAVAQQFAGVALLAASSILRIFWKEIADSHHRGDVHEVKRLYGEVSKGLFFVGAVAAGGLIPWTGEIIRLALGVAYSSGAVTMMLMFLYPVHQSMGQINGVMFLATGNTRIFVSLGVAGMLMGLVVAYLLLAPVDAIVPGLNLASQGLAWKMVALQILFVNLQAWFVARAFGWKYEWSYQIIGLGLAVAAGWLAKALVVAGLDAPILVKMVLAAAIHLALMLGLVYRLPKIVGMDRKTLLALYKR